MDYIVSYIYKTAQYNGVESPLPAVKGFQIENKHFLIHINHYNLCMIQLDNVPQDLVPTRQIIQNAGSRSFPPTHIFRLKNKPICFDYDENVNLMFILDELGHISTVLCKDIAEK